MGSTEISPAPTPEQAAAIVATVEALWPKPAVPESGPRTRSVAWRFSGRWWQRDRFAPSERPWT